MNEPVTTTTIDPAEFRKVLGSYPTGVCVITALDDDDRPAGMVVGSFTSVSLDPPLVGFFPDRKSTSWPQIEKAGHFCVNVMASDQTDVCRAVTAKGDQKFVGVDYVVSDHNCSTRDATVVSPSGCNPFPVRQAMSASGRACGFPRPSCAREL